MTRITKLTPVHLLYVRDFVKAGAKVHIDGLENIHAINEEEATAEEKRAYEVETTMVTPVMGLQIPELKYSIEFKPKDKLPKTIDEIEELMLEKYTQSIREKEQPAEKKKSSLPKMKAYTPDGKEIGHEETK